MKLEERVQIITDMCKREIERQGVFMTLAEKKDKDTDWIKHYELQGLYQTILDNFVKKYERLKEIQERYTYRVLLGKDYYYWIPIEYLPY